MQQQDEYSIEMRLEAEAQARSAAFLLGSVAKYFTPRPSPKTICQRCAATGCDLEASDATIIPVCPDCNGSGYLVTYIDTHSYEREQRELDRYAQRGEWGSL